MVRQNGQHSPIAFCPGLHDLSKTHIQSNAFTLESARSDRASSKNHEFRSAAKQAAWAQNTSESCTAPTW